MKQNRRGSSTEPLSAYHCLSVSQETISNKMVSSLAAKTCCKDRWRQVINEANRIEVKHLLTLQEGVSPNQFQEMEDEGIRLVVPKQIHRKYHKDIRGKLMRFDEFINEMTQNLEHYRQVRFRPPAPLL